MRSADPWTVTRAGLNRAFRPLAALLGASALLLCLTTPAAAAVSDAWPPTLAERQQLFVDDPRGTALEIDSLLAHVQPRSNENGFVQQLVQEHVEATGDSLLWWDAGFVADLSLEDRRRWWRAVQQDAEGFALRRAREYEASAGSFAQAADTYRALGEARRLAVVLGSRGVSLWYLGDFDVVRQAYEEALEARVALGDATLIGRTQNSLGSVAQRQGNYEAALAWYDKARHTREQLDDTVALGVTLSYTGNVHYLMGDLEQARHYYGLAIATMGEGAPARRLNPAKMGLANVHNDLGEFEEAITLYQEQVRASETNEDFYRVALNRTNLGHALRSKGDYAEALQELQQAAALFDTLGEGWDEAVVLNTLGSVQGDLGDHAQALRTFRRAESLAREFENTLEVNNAIINMAFVYSSMGLPEKALETSERGLQEVVAAGDSVSVSFLLSQMAQFRKEQDDLDAALELFEESLELTRRLGPQSMLPTRLVDVGNTLSSMGRTSEARSALREAVERGDEMVMLNVLWGAWLGIGDTFEREGRLAEARDANAEAIAILEQLRARELTEQQRANLLEGSAFAYEAQVHVLAKMHAAAPQAGHDIAAFTVAEEGRARSLLDVLSEGRVDLSADLSSDLAQDIARVERQLATVRYQLRQGESSQSARQLKKQLRTLENERQQLATRARFEHPRLATLHRGEPTNLPEVRNVLLQERNTTLFQYSLGDSASYLWVITSKSTQLHRLPPRGAIEPHVHSLRTALSSPLATGDATLVRAARQLHDMLLAPAGKSVDKARHLIVVPDGALQFLPFDVLLEKDPKPLDDEADERQRQQWLARLPYALQGKQVVYGPSASTLVVLTQQRQEQDDDRRPTLLAIGDPLFHPDQSTTPPAQSTTRAAARDLPPLPYSRTEVEAIGALFEDDERVLLLGDAARESTLRTQGYMQQQDILHFATHGLIDERFPERSSLALSFPRDPSEDGYLQASEIYSLQLRARLVVLSACETGLGRMLRGEGVLGLPRAFLYAGASSVVMSFWSVSDESTAELMESFYDRLIHKNHAPAKALAEAKKEIRKSDAFAHPFFWSPFVILGAPSS